MTDSVVARVDGLPLVHLDELIWIGDIARRGAQRAPQRDAIIFAERSGGPEHTTYLALDQRSDAFAALLQKRGLHAGDRVAYLGRNSDLFFPALFGAICAGVVLVPINWRLAAPEIAYQLKDSEARLLICDPELQAAADVALQELALPPTILLTEDDNAEQGLRTLLSQPAPAAPLPQVHDQVILQLYTSGTTGNPKGVLISHYALSVARHAELISPDFSLLATGQTSLSAMPNFHVGGMSWVLMGLVRLGTVVISADPSPGNMLKLIRDYAIDHSFIVPSALRAIVDDLKLRQLPAPQMKGIFYGAMTMGESLLREAMGLFGCSFVQFFGMTENTGSVTFLAPQDHDPAHPRLLGSVGKPYPGMSVEIRGADGQLLNVGQHGEIWIKSPTQLLGYWKLPEKSREAVVAGWYASGDGGYLDAGGYLYLTDRIKDMIVSGGENIYPAEVEEILRGHPAVLDVACIGVPDAHWGEIVVAVVELRPGLSSTEEELRGLTRARIAGFKCPKRVHFIPILPRTASGKVKRAELRKALQNPFGSPAA